MKKVGKPFIGTTEVGERCQRKPILPSKNLPQDRRRFNSGNPKIKDGKRISKKVASLGSRACSAREWEKVIAINELKHEFKLNDLLLFAKLPRSTFYYHLKKMKLPDKYKQIKAQISEIFHNNRGRYSYRRITLTLRKQGTMINHKTLDDLNRVVIPLLMRESFGWTTNTSLSLMPNFDDSMVLISETTDPEARCIVTLDDHDRITIPPKMAELLGMGKGCHVALSPSNHQHALVLVRVSLG